MTDGAGAGQTQTWQRHLFYRKASLRTTWKLRVALFAGVAILVSVTRGFWIPGIARSLVCNGQSGPAEAVLVDNFDVNYLLFERAAALQRGGLSARILVPTQATSDPEEPNLVSKDIVEVMTHVSRLQHAEIIPIQVIEPISLNAAYQLREFLTKHHIRSVAVVTPGFRSRRSALVYRAVFSQSGIMVSCIPVFGTRVPENWTWTWHGIQLVTEQFLKLVYYRVYVLPFVLSNHAPVIP
jgi:hypothetical protein